MTDWIQGSELLTPPFELTKRELYYAVVNGDLVPHVSPDGKKRRVPGEFIVEDKRVFRFFPTDELRKWDKELLVMQEAVAKAIARLKKSDEELIEEHKAARIYFDQYDDDRGKPLESLHVAKAKPTPSLPDLVTFASVEILKMRELDRRTIEEQTPQIEELEKKLAPDRAWKNLDLDPDQQEKLMNKLAECSYPAEQVEALHAKTSHQQIATEGGSALFPPHPGTKWEEILVKTEGLLPCLPETKREEIHIKKEGLLPCPHGTKWENIKITLVEDDTVRIETPEGQVHLHFAALGLQDGRSGNKPTMLWALLKIFAENSGFINPTNIEYNRKLTDTAKRLDTKMRRIFGIQESIYKGHYKRESGYRTKIVFKDATFGPKPSD